MDDQEREEWICRTDKWCNRMMAQVAPESSLEGFRDLGLESKLLGIILLARMSGDVQVCRAAQALWDAY